MEMRITLCRLAALAALLLFISPTVAESPHPDAAADAWRALTTADVEAAHALLVGNDPAAVPAAADQTFLGTLDAAYTRALARASTVTSYPGYVATLGEFANAMSDGHIWSRPRYVAAGLEWAGIEFRPPSLEWAGLVVAKRGTNWVIAKEDPGVVGEDLVGARLIDCGGKPIDDFARQTLGRYRVVWSVEAMRVLAAPWLLVDEGNPFVTRPDACTIRTASGTREITLHWKRESREKFVELIGDVHGKAGFGLRAVGPGYWISIESLSAKAQAVIDAATAEAPRLRAAPFVVVDLRGNSGGGDSYGRALADALYGPAHAAAVLGPQQEEGICPEAWRASPENIAAEETAAKRFEAEGETEGARAYRAAAVRMRSALEQHRALTAPLSCSAPMRIPVLAVPSLMRGHVLVLTDSVCFSSCINTVGFFTKLGATLVGQTTGADTHYSEVREIVLPSGLSSFSTLQAIDPTQPLHIGPYVPRFPYAGDISDTPALERWISDTVVPALH
jgi:hypothetical protein